MNIPDFLRPEYVSPEKKEADEMLNECIERHITIWELWGEEYDEEALY